MDRRRFLAGLSLGGMAGITNCEAKAQSTGKYGVYTASGPFGLPRNSLSMQPIPELNLMIWLPPEQARGKVVVFSHAELSTPNVYSLLLRHWASHGYAVIAPIHADSVVEQGITNYTTGLRQGDLRNIEKVFDKSSIMRRLQDCMSVLDVLPIVERNTGFRFIAERPIITGHSFGAFIAQLLIGARILDRDGSVFHAPDPRYYAAILMSPQGRGVLGLGNGSWDTVNRPLLTITGPGEADLTGQPAEVKAEPFSLSPEGYRHLAWFNNMSAAIYRGDRLSPGSKEAVAFLDYLAITTAFLGAYSGYNQSDLNDISGSYYEEVTNGRVSMRYR